MIRYCIPFFYYYSPKNIAFKFLHDCYATQFTNLFYAIVHQSDDRSLEDEDEGVRRRDILRSGSNSNNLPPRLQRQAADMLHRGGPGVSGGGSAISGGSGSGSGAAGGEGGQASVGHYHMPSYPPPWTSRMHTSYMSGPPSGMRHGRSDSENSKDMDLSRDLNRYDHLKIFKIRFSFLC